jgi:hypothetical protein
MANEYPIVSALKWRIPHVGQSPKNMKLRTWVLAGCRFRLSSMWTRRLESDRGAVYLATQRVAGCHRLICITGARGSAKLVD